MSGCRTEVLQEENNDDDDNDDEEEEEKEVNKTEQKSKETESIKTNERSKEAMEHDLGRGSNLSKVRNEIDYFEKQYHNKLTSRCYQLKMHHAMDNDYGQVVRNIYESEIVQPVLDRIKLVEDQWRTLDLWEILLSVNLRPLIKFGRDELFKQDSTLLENKEDMNFKWSIVLCSIFENLMRTLGWKVGDTLDIEEDICDVVGQLLMKVGKQDKSSLLDCMQTKRRKLFELDGLILEDEEMWLDVINKKVESAVANQTAVLVICEDIVTVNKIQLTSGEVKATRYSHTNVKDGGRMNKTLKPGDVVITTNLGARGTDFVADGIINKNGGLFVLVTFIPMNDRVEKQAFGRTGRRGATGSCQIVVHRKKMAEWLRSCGTVDEAKRLRDSIEMHRLNNTTELILMRNKQKLFQEYCELKKEFITSNTSESNDLKIQEEILDETWAEWIQEYERSRSGSHIDEMVQELHNIMEDCSKQATKFESDNIYHIMEFGAIRLMKGDFEGATKFYDQVIRMDPDWSAFAHYNRAFCTIQMKSDEYIRRAIDDLKAR